MHTSSVPPGPNFLEQKALFENYTTKQFKNWNIFHNICTSPKAPTIPTERLRQRGDPKKSPVTHHPAPQQRAVPTGSSIIQSIYSKKQS